MSRRGEVSKVVKVWLGLFWSGFWGKEFDVGFFLLVRELIRRMGILVFEIGV